MTNEEIDKLHDFYEVNIEQTTLKDIILNRLKIINKLKELGYYRYDTDNGSSLYVKVEDKRISLTNEEHIIDAFEDYIKNLPTRTITKEDKDGFQKEIFITNAMLLDKLYRNLKSYFQSLMRLRPDEKIVILDDTPDRKYLFFKSRAVYIDKQGIHNVEYKDLNGYIWESSMLKYDLLESDMKGDFEKFVENITGNAERKKSLMSMMGYLMHNFFEDDEMAVIFTDKTDEIGNATGGTGKGILGQALSHILNRDTVSTRYVSINGKDIDLSSDTRYALADLSTCLIHIEDIYKGVDFEKLFNDVTEGAVIRKKHGNPIKKRIKMMLSVNHTIRLSDSGSKMRRACIFELEDYYGAHKRPGEDFDKRFFGSKWDDIDWGLFYNFMCKCIQVYMENGVIKPTNEEYYKREFIESVGEEFANWIVDVIRPVKEEQLHDKKNLYERFKEEYSMFSLHQRTFTNKCRHYFKYKRIPYVEFRNPPTDYFAIYPTKETQIKAQNQKEKM